MKDIPDRDREPGPFQPSMPAPSGLGPRRAALLGTSGLSAALVIRPDTHTNARQNPTHRDDVESLAHAAAAAWLADQVAQRAANW